MKNILENDFLGLKMLSLETGDENSLSKLKTIRTSSFEEKSFFKDSPFGQYWEKRIPKYAEATYGPGLALGNEPFRIFDLSKKLSQTQTAIYKSQIIESWDDIQFKVYANPDGDQVLKEYAGTDYTPEDNEILFFIETDDGRFDFGKIVRVKLGKKAIEKLHFQFPFLGETDEEELAEVFMKRTFEVKNNPSYNFIKASEEVSLDTSELKKLLTKAIKYDYDQKKFDDMSWYLAFLQHEEWIGLNTPKKVMEISQWMRSKKYKEDKYWNAFSKEEFTPAFLPQFTIKDKAEVKEETIKQRIRKKIDELIEREDDDGLYTKIFKDILHSVLSYLFEAFYQTINIVGFALTESGVLYSLNAFLVGLWNGCVEFFAGIVDLVALVMMIAKDGIDYVLTDALSESLENLMNNIVYNFENFIKKLWDKFMLGLEKFPDWFLKYGTNPYFWYKELGELTPDIISIVVPALKAGKASKLAGASKVGSTVARETTEEVSEEIIEQSAKELSKKLEKEAARKEVKESFEKAETELEDRIPKETEIDEVVVGGANKKIYSLWKINLKEGRYNCANCAIATDATLAGRPASALPYTIQKRFRNGKKEMYASYKRGTEPIVLEKEFDAKFSSAWTTNLDDLVKDLKPGKRGIIFGYKKGSNMGHVFNVINENGVIKYLDGQTGRRAKLVYDYYKFLPTN